jgi:hypothetical protein
MPAVAPSRVAIAALAVCLLAGTAVAVGGAALADGPQLGVVAVDNSSSYLQPETNETTTQAYVHADVDVGVAVAGDVAAIRGTHESLAVEQAMGAQNRTARVTRLRAILATLENRTAATERALREARVAHLEGDLSRDELARTLARYGARADALESIRTTVEDVATSMNPLPGTAVTNAQNLEAALETIGGPGTDRLRDRYRGNRSAGATYLSIAGEDGLVVASVAEGTLYREALEADQRRVGGTDRFADTDEPEISVALRRAAELYPWAFEQGSAAQPLRGYGNTTVYRITAEHPHGTLSTYLDGTTRAPFYEIQRLRAGAVPVRDSVTEAADGLRLTINRTQATGPMGVTVVREATGSPVDAVVSIDEARIGRTGDDGHLWTVQPGGEATVTASTGENTTVAAAVG